MNRWTTLDSTSSINAGIDVGYAVVVSSKQGYGIPEAGTDSVALLVRVQYSIAF
jgi:hypothetical protein